jgi:hypothetical protein
MAASSGELESSDRAVRAAHCQQPLLGMPSQRL